SPYPPCLRQYPHHHTTTDRFTHERLEKKMVHPLVSIRSLKVEEEAYKAFVSSGGVCEQRWWFGIDDCIRKDVLLMKINGVDPVTFEPSVRVMPLFQLPNQAKNLIKILPYTNSSI
ncbi:unnamed protein product, partial [Brassica oleracea]